MVSKMERIEEVVKVPIEDIKLYLFSPRAVYDIGKIKYHILELVESIKIEGLIEPVKIHKSTMGCIDGVCRILACRDYLAWSEIDAIILDITEDEAYKMAGICNTGLPLDAISEGKWIMKMNELGYSNVKIANIKGKSEKWVRDRLALLQLDPAIQKKLIRTGYELSYGRELARIEKKIDQLKLSMRILDKNGKVRLQPKDVKSIVNKSLLALSMLEPIDENIATQIKEDFKKLLWTENLDLKSFDYEVKKATGEPVELKEVKVSSSLFDKENEAIEFFKKSNGTLISKETLYVGMVDYYKFEVEKFLLEMNRNRKVMNSDR
jgi:ParB-like chromosome segregation protein Spo0J